VPGLEVRPFGPFVRGAIDAANEGLELKGSLRYARNVVMDGVGRLKVRPGTALAMTLKDDQGSPANVTSVVCIVPFGDGALAVAHSDVTDKFYLYRFNSELTGWFNAAGALQSNTNAEPVGVLWTAATDPAKVLIAEGLGEAYIAHNNAGSSFRSKVYTVAGGITNLNADLRGSGVEATYFRGFVSFQQHLWGWGYGSEAAADNDRPELLRFGFATFATVGGGYFAQADSITVGHRVRTASERVVGAVVAGQVLYVGTRFSIWPVTGFGRNSWDKSRPLDDSYGFAGVLAAVSANGILHYWSHRGPLRVAGLERPDPLWDAVTVAASGVVSPTDIVAVFDADRDQVMYVYRNPTSGRVSVLAAVDTRRDAWLGPDGDLGLGIACAGVVHPTDTAGPTGPPTSPSTTNIGSTTATANVTPGDSSPGTTTIWEYKRTVDPSFTVAAETPASQTSYQFTGLTEQTDYQWRAKHLKNGQSSTYSGPTAFSTTSTLAPPSGCGMSAEWQGFRTLYQFTITWSNSGEAGVSTEVHFSGPNGSPPASGTLPLKATVGPGVSNYVFNKPIGPGSGLTFYAEVRHVKSGVPASPYSNMASIVLP
jgi:hypothetical protein